MARGALTEAELALVREAVAEAERQTGGEIVPYVVGESGRYDVAVWRGAAIGALLAGALGLAVAAWYDGWGLGWLYTGSGLLTLSLVGGAAGAVKTWLMPWLRRLLAGADLLDEQVHRRAMTAFVEEQVFNTRDRTGILLFVSLFEHRIEVIGDEGINAKVKPEEWVEVVERIRKGVRSGHLGDGLVDAIGLCGALLHRRGVELRHDDTDELPDDVRLRDR